jgi:hypothetical protein
VDLGPAGGGFSLDASVQPTPVVWSYRSDSGFKPFMHVRYDTRSPVRAATADFCFEIE